MLHLVPAFQLSCQQNAFVCVCVFLIKAYISSSFCATRSLLSNPFRQVGSSDLRCVRARACRPCCTRGINSLPPSAAGLLIDAADAALWWTAEEPPANQD